MTYATAQHPWPPPCDPSAPFTHVSGRDSRDYTWIVERTLIGKIRCWWWTKTRSVSLSVRPSGMVCDPDRVIEKALANGAATVEVPGQRSIGCCEGVWATRFAGERYWLRSHDAFRKRQRPPWVYNAGDAPRSFLRRLFGRLF